MFQLHFSFGLFGAIKLVGLLICFGRGQGQGGIGGKQLALKSHLIHGLVYNDQCWPCYDSNGYTQSFEHVRPEQSLIRGRGQTLGNLNKHARECHYWPPGQVSCRSFTSMHVSYATTKHESEMTIVRGVPSPRMILDLNHMARAQWTLFSTALALSCLVFWLRLGVLPHIRANKMAPVNGWCPSIEKFAAKRQALLCREKGKLRGHIPIWVPRACEKMVPKAALVATNRHF